MNYLSIKEYMSKRRPLKHWSKRDIQDILDAKESNNWEIVKNSKLYILHGGEYCELLTAINESQ